MAYNPLDVFTGNVQKRAADQQEAAIRQGQQQLEQSYASGRGDLTNYYTQALQPYQQLQQTGAGGYQAYADASGANGPEGLARAQQTFAQSQPGWAGQAQNIANLISRAGNAGGVPAGNTYAAIADRVTQKGLENYGQYTQGLAPWLSQGQQTAAGISGIQTGLGRGLEANQTALGGAQLGAQTKIGEAQAQGTMGELTGYKNLFDAGMNVAKLAAGVPSGGGSMFGGGSSGGGLMGGGLSGLMTGGQAGAGMSFGPFQSPYAGPANPTDWRRNFV